MEKRKEKKEEKKGREKKGKEKKEKKGGKRALAHAGALELFTN